MPQPALSDQDNAISRTLVGARLSAEPLPDFPIQLPTSLEQAYAIQSASIARWPDELVGWKVAMLSPAEQERFNAQRLVGPVFRTSFHTVEAGSSIVMPVYRDGFAAVEAEIVFVLGETIPPTGRDYSDAELASFIATVSAGAEIASSPMKVINDLGAMSVISDFGNNAGVIAGPAVPDWATRKPGFLTATVIVDEAVVGSKAVDAIVGSPLEALRRLVEVSAVRGFDLPAGTVVSTGAITGVHEVGLASTARVNFGPLGGFDIRFEPRHPVE